VCGRVPRDKLELGPVDFDREELGAQTFSGTTNGLRYSRVSNLLASRLSRKRSVFGSMFRTAPRVAGVLARSTLLAARCCSMRPSASARSGLALTASRISSGECGLPSREEILPVSHKALERWPSRMSPWTSACLRLRTAAIQFAKWLELP